MRVVKDEWTPLFQSLESKVSSSGRRKLLAGLIGELQSITIQNFGPAGIARPDEWPELTQRYANKAHGGDKTPKLILTGDMVESFSAGVEENTAWLTNLVPYADEHQFGEIYKNLPSRPFYPITPDGELTPYAQMRLAQVVENHFQV